MSHVYRTTCTVPDIPSHGASNLITFPARPHVHVVKPFQFESLRSTIDTRRNQGSNHFVPSPTSHQPSHSHRDSQICPARCLTWNPDAVDGSGLGVRCHTPNALNRNRTGPAPRNEQGRLRFYPLTTISDATKPNSFFRGSEANLPAQPSINQHSKAVKHDWRFVGSRPCRRSMSESSGPRLGGYVLKQERITAINKGSDTSAQAITSPPTIWLILPPTTTFVHLGTATHPILPRMRPGHVRRRTNRRFREPVLARPLGLSKSLIDPPSEQLFL